MAFFLIFCYFFAQLPNYQAFSPFHFLLFFAIRIFLYLCGMEEEILIKTLRSHRKLLNWAEVERRLNLTPNYVNQLLHKPEGEKFNNSVKGVERRARLSEFLQKLNLMEG